MKRIPSHSEKGNAVMPLHHYPTVAILSIFMLCNASTTLAVAEPPIKTVKPGAVQKGIKIEPKSSFPAMRENLDKIPTTITGEQMSQEMQQTQQQQLAPAVGSKRGEAMPPETTATEVSPRQGMQQANDAKPKVVKIGQQLETYLHLVVEVSKSGSARVLSAARISGQASLSNEVRGDFIYSMELNGETLAVQAVADPFELRAFPRQDAKGGEGHHFQQAETARIIVTVPKAKLVEEKLDQLHFRFFKIKPGTELRIIDTKVFQQLEKSKRLEKIIDLPAVQLAPQIKQRLNVVQ